MAYDQTEAKILFARSHEKRDPITHYQERQQAAETLLVNVVQAAEKAGYKTGRERGMQVIAHPMQGAVYVWLADDVLCVGVPDGKVNKDLPIEYDAGIGYFVGKDDDVFYTPHPGQPRMRRSAVAAVAEVIVKMIDEQANPRRSGR